MPKAITKDTIRLLALIAYRDGEISEGRCVELTGMSRDKIRDEMFKRVGKFRPYDEAEAEAQHWKKEYEELAAIVGRH